MRRLASRAASRGQYKGDAKAPKKRGKSPAKRQHLALAPTSSPTPEIRGRQRRPSVEEVFAHVEAQTFAMPDLDDPEFDGLDEEDIAFIKAASQQQFAGAHIEEEDDFANAVDALNLDDQETIRDDDIESFSQPRGKSRLLRRLSISSAEQLVSNYDSLMMANSHVYNAGAGERAAQNVKNAAAAAAKAARVAKAKKALEDQQAKLDRSASQPRIYHEKSDEIRTFLSKVSRPAGMPVPVLAVLWALAVPPPTPRLTSARPVTDIARHRPLRRRECCRHRADPRCHAGKAGGRGREGHRSG